MWMVFVRRSKSFKSVFSSTTCFNASCVREPTMSHLVLRCALGEIGSCAQQLYSTDRVVSHVVEDADPLLFEELGISVTRHR